MRFTVNPYTLIYEMENTTHFVIDQDVPIQLTLNEGQRHLLDGMCSGIFVESTDLVSEFGKDTVATFIDKHIFVDYDIDIESINSRTDAYFQSYGMPEARKRLMNKSVLILGCGGIGTHMAWHMTSIGIGKLTVVDFDTVEESNLNRQLLFDIKDIGKDKVSVLTDKLRSINSDVEIIPLNAHISSESELESICNSDHYDLIVKSLDSPIEISTWLDNIVKKFNIPYISGITMRENILIGPSYIPGRSKYGFSDIINTGTGSGSRKLFGTAPSLGAALYAISSELAIEAIKILTGYGCPRYIDCIHMRNVITDEEHMIQNQPNKQERISSIETQRLCLNWIILLIISVIGLTNHEILPVAVIIGLVTPFYIYAEREPIIKCTFINSIVISICVISTLVGMFEFTTIITSVIAAFICVSIFSLVMCFANYVFCRILRRKSNDE